MYQMPGSSIGARQRGAPRGSQASGCPWPSFRRDFSLRGRTHLKATDIPSAERVCASSVHVNLRSSVQLDGTYIHPASQWRGASSPRQCPTLPNGCRNPSRCLWVQGLSQPFANGASVGLHTYSSRHGTVSFVLMISLSLFHCMACEAVPHERPWIHVVSTEVIDMLLYMGGRVALVMMGLHTTGIPRAREFTEPEAGERGSRGLTPPWPDSPEVCKPRCSLYGATTRYCFMIVIFNSQMDGNAKTVFSVHRSSGGG
ncbi:hypothetical protein BD309DRAFT_23821 [Dichomitus squalens]|nr:hypothetical protein BD309DRAFT_23821 [Dichomitus squalens]